MTNQQAANTLKIFCNQLHTGRGSTKSGLEFDILNSLVKAIDLLENTSDTPTKQSFKFKIGDKVMSTKEPWCGVGVIDDINKHKDNYYYDIAYEGSYELFVPEEELTNVNE